MDKPEVAVPAANPHRGPDEIARLGSEIFDRLVRPRLRPDDDGKFVAVDIGSGEYELDHDDFTAVTRLRNRRPAADVWLGRVGQPAAYRLRRNGNNRFILTAVHRVPIGQGQYRDRQTSRT